MIVLTIPAMLVLLCSIICLLSITYYKSKIQPILKRKGIFLQVFGIIIALWISIVFNLPSIILSILYFSLDVLYSSIIHGIPFYIIGLIVGLVFFIPGRVFVKKSKILVKDDYNEETKLENMAKQEQDISGPNKIILGISIIGCIIFLLLFYLYLLILNWIY